MEEDLPPVPTSPSQSLATTALGNISNLNLPLPSAPPIKVLTKTDLEQSLQAAEDLLSSAKAYRNALTSLSLAASSFGASLEKIARCNGTGTHGDGLLAASGLQFLIANHQQVLSETVYREFEVPLLHDLDNYKASMGESAEKFRQASLEQSKNLRRTEKDHMKLAKNKRRDLSAFRTALVELTRQIDELDKLRYDHYSAAFELSEDMAGKALDAAAVTARAEVEIYEAIARKGWSGGGLDGLMARSNDPFQQDDVETQAGDGNIIFSILPEQSILPNPRSPSLENMDKYAGIAVALNHTGDMGSLDGDNESIFSQGASRGLPPFSPRQDGILTPLGQPPPLQISDAHDGGHYYQDIHENRSNSN